MKNKKAIVAVLALMIITLVGITVYYWYNNTHYLSTEDAQVAGEIYKVSPQITGEILNVNVEEGDQIQTGEVIARIDDVSLPSGANMDRSLVRSPINGLVIKKLAHPGEIGAAGQPVAMVVRPDDLYITANIEETDMHKVKIGQLVDIALDSLPGEKFRGRVEHIGEASLSTFSLLSQANAGGNFTKVVQRVPVRIRAEDIDSSRLMYGTNAVVRIHVQ